MKHLFALIFCSAAFLFAQADEVPQNDAEQHEPEQPKEAPSVTVWDFNAGKWVPLEKYSREGGHSVFSQVPFIKPSGIDGAAVIENLFRSENERLQYIAELRRKGFF